jgi:hypothetical protein
MIVIYIYIYEQYIYIHYIQYIDILTIYSIYIHDIQIIYVINKCTNEYITNFIIYIWWTCEDIKHVILIGFDEPKSGYIINKTLNLGVP